MRPFDYPLLCEEIGNTRRYVRQTASEINLQHCSIERCLNMKYHKRIRDTMLDSMQVGYESIHRPLIVLITFDLG